ncbi:phospholipase D-like domain-containing protein [Halomonas ramblicola]|uniref:phospholipase D-like domain-containing protein n=1 Tax=Halomonas ramblicola TaxID=747349 RepID=UPI0025B4BC03|nr:phospholipase D-like domain-containing protein [Halomonas ramblicola]MDN3520284.1 phospholipase D-like domain-containing protein [Halomonas ramblicola]
MSAWLGGLLLAAATAWLATAWWHGRKPLPPGLHVAAPWRPAAGVELLLDEACLDAHGRWRRRRAIFAEWRRLIAQARRLVVIDLFLLDDGPLGRSLCRALIRRKARVPGLEALVLVDPINHCYGGRPAPQLEALRRAGVRVATCDLTPGRDPNPAWTALWRGLFRPLGNATRGGWLPDPLGPGRVTLRSYLALLNFNANHRKTLVVDHDDGWRAVVSSANADSGSRDYRNAALRLAGPAALDLLHSELALAHRSGLAPLPCGPAPPHDAGVTAVPRLRLLTEGAIRDTLLGILDGVRPGETLEVCAYYLAHRRVIHALLAAHRRGVALRLLLDPNDSHFGRASPGIPNRQTARELARAGVAIRWSGDARAHAHGKWLLRHGGRRPATLLIGSANLSRRSLDDHNFEANIQLEAAADHPVIRQARESFARYWHNRHGETHSRPFQACDDATAWRYWRYRLMEASGWSTF